MGTDRDLFENAPSYQMGEADEAALAYEMDTAMDTVAATDATIDTSTYELTEVWNLPRLTANINETLRGVIQGDSFDIKQDIVWNEFELSTAENVDMTDSKVSSNLAVANEGLTVIDTLSEDNTYVDYNIVNSITQNSGSFPIKVGYNYNGSLYAYVLLGWGLGDVTRPTFKNSETYDETIMLTEGHYYVWQNLPIEQRRTVYYGGEKKDIASFWKSTTNYSDMLDAAMLDLSKEVYALTPQASIQSYQKSEKKALQLDKLSIFSESEVDGSVVSVAISDTTSIGGSY